MLPRTALTRSLGWALATVLVLSACSGDGDDPGAEGDPTASASETYLPVPDGVDLTPQGSELSLGDTATVAYRPRQDTVGVLDLTVTRLEKASFKQFVGWKLTPDIKESAPYFVHATVENVGESDLGGKSVPLYGVDGDNTLLQAFTFASVFKPCPGESFPKSFGPGDKFKACLVYLAADKGDLTGASFRPDEVDSPIVWTGEVTDARADGGKDKKKDKNDKNENGKKKDKGKKG